MDADANAKLGDAMMNVVMGQAMRDKLAEGKREQEAMVRTQAEAYERALEGNAKDEEEDDDEFIDEDAREIMERMKEARLRDAKNEFAFEEKKNKKQDNVWSGEYTEIPESDFLSYVTKAEYSAVHFSHRDFERCKIFDHHLQIIAPEHKECKFLKLDAEKAPFFVQKLAIMVLPTICLFKNGVLVDKIVGFEELGGKDDFKTLLLIRRLVKAGVLKPKNDDEKGIKISKGKNKGDSDEDSDDDF